MVKTILFDFWGTLVENGVKSPTKQIRTLLNLKLSFSEYVTRLERAMMTRKYSSLREAFLNVCAEFSIEPQEEILEEMVGLWNKSWMLAELYPETEEVLAELNEKYNLILISNTDSFSVEKVLDKFKMNKYFEKCFFSYNLGFIKTNPAFFRKVLLELKLNPEECIVVGDSIQSDIMAAKNAGIKAILVDRMDTRDYPLKVKSLKELKELLLTND